MLSGIASYLFGSSSTEEPQQHEGEKVEDTKTAPVVAMETEASQETDWVVVEYSGTKVSSHVEISPMENLLIEHPSMSVYNRSGSTGEPSDISESSSEDNQVTRQVKTRSQNVQRQAPKRARTVSARAQLMTQVAAIKSAQRVKHQQASRSYNKKSFQRSNSVSCRHTKAKSQGQRNRVAHPSGQKCGRVPQRKQ